MAAWFFSFQHSGFCFQKCSDLLWEMVFCYQNSSGLQWEKIVLVIEKTFEIRGWRPRIFNFFVNTRTVSENSFWNGMLFQIWYIRKIQIQLGKIIGFQKPTGKRRKGPLFLMPCPSQLPRASNKERLLSLAPLYTKVGMHRRKKGRNMAWQVQWYTAYIFNYRL